MHDALLEWCSERVTGRIEHFREAHDWLRARTKTISEWGLALYTFQILGHLEVDWSNRTWAIAPAVITVLDDSGGNAALIGARPRVLMRRLLVLEHDPDPRAQELAEQIMLTEPVRRPDAPATYFMTGPHDEALEALCEIMGIRFEHRVAMRIREALPSLDSYLSAGTVAAAPPGVEMRRLVADGSLRWVDVDDDDAPGAYEYQGYGAPRYQFVDQSDRYESDKGIVTFAELRRVARQVIFYSPNRQEMYVPGRTPLPMLAARCAVLRTALLPTFSREPTPGVPTEFGGLSCYRNIPPLTYRAVCDAVGQDASAGLLR